MHLNTIGPLKLSKNQGSSIKKYIEITAFVVKNYLRLGVLGWTCLHVRWSRLVVIIDYVGAFDRVTAAQC